MPKKFKFYALVPTCPYLLMHSFHVLTSFNIGA